MRFVSTIALLLCLAGTAFAQEEPMQPERIAPSEDRGPSFLFATAYGRLSGLHGNAIKDFAEWNEIFKPGVGAGFEVGLPWNREARYGFFASGEIDLFAGDKFEDDLGSTLEPDAMVVPSVFLGMNAEDDLFGPITWEGRIAFGAGFIPSIDAEWDGTTTAELFRESIVFVGEVGLRFAWGPITVGTGVRYLSAPRKGDGIEDIEELGGITLTIDPMVGYFGEVGLSFDF